MEEWALFGMADEFLLHGVETEAELADVEAVDVVVVDGVGAVVPGLTLIRSDEYSGDCFEFGHLQMHLQRLMVHALVLGVLVVELLLRALLLGLLLFYEFARLLDEFGGDPLVVPAI